MAVAAGGGRHAIRRENIDERVIFHIDRGSTYTAKGFIKACRGSASGSLWAGWDRQRRRGVLLVGVGSAVSQQFRDTIRARAVVIDRCYTFYSRQRRHSAADRLPPINDEIKENS